MLNDMHDHPVFSWTERLSRAHGVRGTVAVLIALGLEASPVAAQTAPAAAPTDTLQEVIVTAGRREESLSNVGEGISAVTGEQLDLRAASSLTDFMALTPGLNVQSLGTPGMGAIALRGISPQSVGATVAIYVDDIPIGGSSALSEGGNFMPDIDPTDLERVEVLKGPQGTLYGASSLGGVIKYVTRQPNLTETDISTSEDFNDVQGGRPGVKLRASVSTPIIQDTLAIRVSGSYRYDGGYIDDIGASGVGARDANRGDDTNFRASLLYQPAGNLSIRLNASGENSRVNGLNSVDYNVNTLTPLYGDLEQLRYTPEHFTNDTRLYSLDVKWDTAFGSLISATSYSVSDPSQATDFTTAFGGVVPYVSATEPASSQGNHADRQTTQELRFTSNRIDDVLEFIAGGFYQHEYLRDLIDYYSYNTSGQVNSAVPALALDVRSGGLSEYAGFGDATVYITPRVDLTLGYRHSLIDQTRSQSYSGILFSSDDPTAVTTNYQKFSESSNTYLAGARWRITDDVMAYARAASGYRPGGGRTIPPGAPAGFADYYTSDSIWSYEAGTKIRALDGRLTADFDMFWINWSNIQTFIPVGSFSTDGNAGTARSRGAELQVDYVLLKGLTVGANAAYTNARFTQGNAAAGVVSGDRIAFVPTRTTTAYSTYSVPLRGAWSAELGAEYDYRSSQLDTTRIVLPGYSTVNIHAGVRSSNQTITFYIKNLTNERGLIGSLGYGGAPEFPALIPVVITQPRTFGITFTQKF